MIVCISTGNMYDSMEFTMGVFRGTLKGRALAKVGGQKKF